VQIGASLYPRVSIQKSVKMSSEKFTARSAVVGQFEI
jgi:hypothetical protein